jgi:hypothetical protein
MLVTKLPEVQPSRITEDSLSAHTEYFSLPEKLINADLFDPGHSLVREEVTE